MTCAPSAKCANRQSAAKKCMGACEWCMCPAQEKEPGAGQVEMLAALFGQDACMQMPRLLCLSALAIFKVKFAHQERDGLAAAVLTAYVLDCIICESHSPREGCSSGRQYCGRPNNFQISTQRIRSRLYQTSRYVSEHSKRFGCFSLSN